MSKQLVAPKAPHVELMRATIGARNELRRDLVSLCHSLNYHDIDRRIHGPFVEPLEEISRSIKGDDIWDQKEQKFFWIPDEVDLQMAVGSKVFRRFLFLAFRGYMKTTMNVIAHTIQLKLLQPHLTMMIYHAAKEVAKEIFDELSEHFFNYESEFAELFPEMMINPELDKKARVGQKLWHPIRKICPKPGHNYKEACIGTNSVDKSQAGGHVHAIRFTDVVEENNSRTPEALQKLYRQINTAFNLLHDPKCLGFVEGTNYQDGDAYSKLIEVKWDNVPTPKRRWKMVVIPAYRKSGASYNPDDYDKPYALAEEEIVWAPGIITEKGKRIPHYPTWRGKNEKWSNRELEEMEEADPDTFAMQQLLCPSEAPSKDYFKKTDYVEVPLEAETRLKFVAHQIVTDSAETNQTYSNDSAFAVIGTTSTGFKVVRYADFGRMLGDEFISNMITLWKKWRPFEIILEECSYLRGLQYAWMKEEDRGEFKLPIRWVSRDRNVSKKDRIWASLQPVIREKGLKFSEKIRPHCKERVLRELKGFPMEVRDDLLDALSDGFRVDSIVPVPGRKKEKTPEEEEAELMQAMRQIAKEEAFSKEDLIGDSHELGIAS